MEKLPIFPWLTTRYVIAKKTTILQRRYDATSIIFVSPIYRVDNIDIGLSLLQHVGWLRLLTNGRALEA